MPNTTSNHEGQAINNIDKKTRTAMKIKRKKRN